MRETSLFATSSDGVASVLIRPSVCISWICADSVSFTTANANVGLNVSMPACSALAATWPELPAVCVARLNAYRNDAS